MGLLSPELKKGPCVLDQIVRDDTEKKGLVRSTVSTHLFQPDLADDLVAGVHKGTVQAKEEVSRVHNSRAMLETSAGLNGSEGDLRCSGP